MGDFENIEAIKYLANHALPGGGREFAFTIPQVFQAIKLCTTNGIAVLGVETFEIKCGEYHTKALSSYELQLHNWDQFVKKNNALAEAFIDQNPAGDGHVYVLTTSSRGEFSRIIGR